MRLPRKVPKESGRCHTGANKKEYPFLRVKWFENIMFGVVYSVFLLLSLMNISLDSMSKRIALLENKIV